MKSKKGLFFEAGIVFMFLIVMIFAFGSLGLKYKEVAEERKLGDLQFGLIEVMQDPEIALLYIDQSAKYAGVKAAYILAENSGFKDDGCGEFKDIKLWYSEEGECFPEYKKNFLEHFDYFMTEYLIRYDGRITSPETGVLIPINHHNYLLKPEKGRLMIEGFAVRNMDYQNKIFKYSIKPSFGAVIDYDINEYEILRDKIVGVIYSCHNQTDVEKCVKQEIVHPYKLTGSDDRTFSVEYQSNRILFEEDPLIYKFAFFVPEKDLPIARSPNLVYDLTDEAIVTMSNIYSKQLDVANSSLIRAIIMQESSGNPNAIRCEQSYEDKWRDYAARLDCARFGCDSIISQGPWKGFHKLSCSYGLMQLMYPTAMETCSDIVTTPESLYDPNINVECGTRYLLKQIENCGSVKRGVYAYNHGPAKCMTAHAETDSYVASVKSKCNQIGGCEILA